MVLENRRYRAEISPRGAELRSFVDRLTDDQILWQGNPSVWAGRSPVLFPVVGKLRGDRYLADGRPYSMPKHGFARNSDFEPEQVSATASRFTLTDTVKSREVYPFSFRLTLGYTLLEEGLRVVYHVLNPGKEELPFSIGAHPGFCCDAGDRLEFEKPERSLAHRLDAQGLLAPADTPVWDASGRRIALAKGLFDRGALILEGLASRTVTLTRRSPKRRVRLSLNAPPPCLGIWAFPDSPYVCIEPWYGLDDTPGPVRELKEKPYMRILRPGQDFSFRMTISTT